MTSTVAIPESICLGGAVCWITGLSGSGKSTLATKVAGILRNMGNTVIILDGDDLREIFGVSREANENYCSASRRALARKYSRLCALIAAQGIVVVIATISMFDEVFDWNRRHLPGYFEVYLKVPIDELRRRDPKGIYRRFYAGELNGVAGLDVPIDVPTSPDLIVDFAERKSIDGVASDLICLWREKVGQ